MSDDAAPGSPTVHELVPEYCPPLPAVEPVRTHRVHWLLSLPAALLALLFPRRFGPHLAASGWLSAYLAHVLSIALSFGTFWGLIWENSRGEYPSLPIAELSWTEPLRYPLAACVLFAFVTFTSWPAVAVAAILTLIGQAALWAGATVLIPMYAAGERLAALYLRCVKLVLWSTAALIPFAWSIVGLTWWSERHNWPLPETTFLSLTMAWLAWYVSVLLRLGSRYGGPKDGPGWQPRPLRCETCGYTLAMLPLAGQCPECGRPVADSLPHRRMLPPFARADSLTKRLPAYVRTVRLSLASRRFARALCVWQGHEAARRFACWTCALIGLLVALALLPIIIGAEDTWYYEPDMHSIWVLALYLTRVATVVLAAGIFSGLGVLGLLLAVGGFLTRFGFRDATRTLVVLCYSAGWLLLPTVLGIAGVWSIIAADAWLPLSGTISLPLCPWPIDLMVLVAIALMLPAIAAFLLWFLHVRWQLRETRFANG